MAKHEFGVLPKVSEEAYEEYCPQKYHCVSVDDNDIYPLLEELSVMDTFFHQISKAEKGLNYCGITLIAPSSLAGFIKILTAKENSVYDDLAKILESALAENKYVIHFGI